MTGSDEAAGAAGPDPVGSDPAGPDPAGSDPTALDPAGSDPAGPDPAVPDPGPAVAAPGAEVRGAPRARVHRLAGPASAWLGVAAATVGGLLALLSVPGAGLLTVGVALVQLLLVLTVLVVLDTPARLGAALLALVAAGAADAVVLRGDGRVGDLAGVVALALVAALLHQLSRRAARTAVTLSLAGTLLAVVLVAAAACLLGLRDGVGGRAATVAALVAGGLCLLLLHLGRQRGAGRGALELPGLLVGLVAGAAVGAVVGAVSDDLPVGRGALLGLACAAAVAVADRLLDRAGAPGGPGGRRRFAALRPVTVLLPYAVLGPVALVAGRLAVG